MYLERINEPEDVKKLNVTQLKVLANEVRQTLLEKLSRHGGHFGPNLGMVEAIIALHAVTNLIHTKCLPAEKTLFYSRNTMMT